LRHQSFNNKLLLQLEQLVFEIPGTDTKKQKELLEIKTPLFKKILLFIPAVIGWVVHAPLYLPARIFTWKKTYNNDHFDSIMTAILVFSYPVYLLLLTLLLFLFTKSLLAFLLLLFLPFTAWSYVQLKPQLDK
jgi:1-acyl-sn-glycerol-3-phosphate acyltransferase